MAKWPSYLPNLVIADDYSETWLDGIKRSEMLVGPAKTRRRFTRLRRQLTRSFVVDKFGYSLFWDYVNGDLAGGARAFEVAHPITGLEMSVKLAAMPSHSPIGVDAFRITLSLEEQ